VLARAFVPFGGDARHVTQNSGGVGLGLAIAAHIMALNGGAKAPNAIGRPLIVELRLPSLNKLG
jgi:K+-sensing histidine kinase KdpD